MIDKFFDDHSHIQGTFLICAQYQQTRKSIFASLVKRAGDHLKSQHSTGRIVLHSGAVFKVIKPAQLTGSNPTALLKL